MQGETVSKRATQRSDMKLFDNRLLKEKEINNSVRVNLE
jgi:hypothetical protein